MLLDDGAAFVLAALPAVAAMAAGLLLRTLWHRRHR
jgi:hypothetical protein